MMLVSLNPAFMKWRISCPQMFCFLRSNSIFLSSNNSSALASGQVTQDGFLFCSRANFMLERPNMSETFPTRLWLSLSLTRPIIVKAIGLLTMPCLGSCVSKVNSATKEIFICVVLHGIVNNMKHLQ